MPSKGPGFNLKKAIDIIESRWRDDKDLRQEWDDYGQMYRSEFWKKELGEDLSRVAVNYLFANIHQILPLMTDNRPVWSVVSRQSEFQPLMNVWNAALHYLWTVLDMDEKLPIAYLDALLSETGFFQVDWDSDEDDVSVDAVDPRHMVFPIGYDNLDDCPWVCKRRAHPISWVRRTYPEYSGKVQSDRSPEDSEESRDHEKGGDGDSFGASNEWVTVFELWMVDDTVEEELESNGSTDGKENGKVKTKLKYPNGRFLVFTKSGVDNEPVLLDDYASPYGHGKSPFVTIYDYRRPHQIWGIGEARPVEGLIDDLNETMQSLSSKVRNNSRVNYVVDTNRVDAGEFRQKFARGNQVFESKGVGSAPTHSGQDRPDPGVYLVPVSPPLQSEYQYLEQLVTFIEEISGVTEVSKGVADKKAEQTAQEVSTLIETTYTRTRQRVRNLESSIKKLLHRILSIMMENYTEDHSFYVEQDGKATHGKISNQRARALEIMRADGAEQSQSGEAEDPYDLSEKDKAMEKLIESLPGDTDQVIARFDISVQTNSTLPLDKQSLANLVLRLAQMGIADARAVLMTLQFPNAEMIADRIEEWKRMEMEGSQGEGNVGHDAQTADPGAGAAPSPVGA